MVDEPASAILKRQGSWRITILSSQSKVIFDIPLNPFWSNWQTNRSKLGAKDYKTSKFHQDMWNRYLMSWYVSAHIRWNARSNLELRRSYKAVWSDLVLPSATTHRNICRREYAQTVDGIMKQLPLRNKLILGLDEWTSTNQLAITWVIASFIDPNWALREVQLAFDEVDCLFHSGFES